MHRNFVLLCAAALLGACASTNTTAGTVEPSTVSTTTSTTTSTSTSSGTTMERRDGRDGREGRGRGMMDPMRMEQMMLRDITLSADQKAKLDSLHSAHMAQEQEMRARGDSMPMMDRDHMRMMMQQHVSEVRAILTPDQQTIFDRNIAEMRNRMQQGGRRGTPPQI